MESTIEPSIKSAIQSSMEPLAEETMEEEMEETLDPLEQLMREVMEEDETTEEMMEEDDGTPLPLAFQRGLRMGIDFEVLKVLDDMFTAIRSHPMMHQLAMRQGITVPPLFPELGGTTFQYFVTLDDFLDQLLYEEELMLASLDFEPSTIEDLVATGSNVLDASHTLVV